MASPRYCIPPGSPIDSLAQRGLAKCAASEPRKLFPFFFAVRIAARYARPLLFFSFFFAQTSFNFGSKKGASAWIASLCRATREPRLHPLCVFKFELFKPYSFFVAAAMRSILILWNRITNDTWLSEEIDDIDRYFRFQLGLRFALIINPNLAVRFLLYFDYTSIAFYVNLNTVLENADVI